MQPFSRCERHLRIGRSVGRSIGRTVVRSVCLVPSSSVLRSHQSVRYRIMLWIDRVARCYSRAVSVRSSCGHFVCFSEFSNQFICGNSCDVIRKLLACNSWRENGQNRQQTEIAEKSESVRIFLHVPYNATFFSFLLFTCMVVSNSLRIFSW